MTKSINIPFAFLLSMVGTLPLFGNMGATLPILQVYVSDGFLLVTASLVLLKRLSRYTTGIVLTGLERFGLLLLLFYVSTYLLAIHNSLMPDIAWLGFRGLIGRVLFVLVIISVVRNYGQFRIVMNAMLFGAVASAVVSMLKLLGIIPLTFPQPEAEMTDAAQFVVESSRQNFGLFYTSGKFAMWHSMAVIYSVVNLLFLKPSLSKRLFYTMVLVLNILAISVSFSRNSIVVTLAGLALVTLLFFREVKVHERLLRPVICVCCLILFVIIASFVSIAVFNFVSEVRGFDTRLGQIFLGFDLLLPDRWLWGAGPNVFSSYDVLGRDLHNAYLSVWVESGLLSLAVFAALIVVPLVSIRWQSQKRRWNSTCYHSQVETMNVFMQILTFCWAISICFFSAQHVHEIWLLIGLLLSFHTILQREEKLRVKERGRGCSIPRTRVLHKHE